MGLFGPSREQIAEQAIRQHRIDRMLDTIEQATMTNGTNGTSNPLADLLGGLVGKLLNRSPDAPSNETPTDRDDSADD